MILPLALLVVLGWLWHRGYFETESKVSDSTLRRIRAEAAMDTSEQDQAGMSRGRREAPEVPTRSTALSRVGIR